MDIVSYHSGKYPDIALIVMLEHITDYTPSEMCICNYLQAVDTLDSVDTVDTLDGYRISNYFQTPEVLKCMNVTG